MRKKYAPEHVMNRDGVYYYVRHIPYDLIAYYNVSRLCFSLKTKSLKAAIHLSEACELYLRLEGVGKDKVFISTANRNTQYVTKLLGDKPISLHSSNEAAQFRDWCIDRGMGIKTVKRVFLSIRAIINLAIAEEGLDCSNAFARTCFPDDDNT